MRHEHGQWRWQKCWLERSNSHQWKGETSCQHIRDKPPTKLTWQGLITAPSPFDYSHIKILVNKRSGEKWDQTLNIDLCKRHTSLLWILQLWSHWRRPSDPNVNLPGSRTDVGFSSIRSQNAANYSVATKYWLSNPATCLRWFSWTMPSWQLTDIHVVIMSLWSDDMLLVSLNNI